MWQWGVVAFMLAAGPMGDEARAAADQARTALAERLEVPVEAIEVIEAEPAEWPNAALGCPEKGQVYAQVLTSGYRVQLGHEDAKEWAHVAGQRVVFCEQTPRTSSRTTLFQSIARVSGEARRDLAKRLGLEEEAVKVERVRPAARAEDAGDCPPTPTVEPPPREEETLLLTLRARGAVHRYRSDRGQLTYCGTP